jgi:hypothetical protein
MSRRFAEIEDQLERVPTSQDVERTLAAMSHHLKVAERIRGDAPDWALTIAHQAIFSGCIALMGAHEYRPRVNATTGLRSGSVPLPCRRMRPCLTEPNCCAGKDIAVRGQQAVMKREEEHRDP